MSLTSIIEEIKTLKPFLEEDILQGPRETYAGREGRQRNARDRMKTLKESYIEELRGSAAFIFVAGFEKDRFCELATTEFNCFKADPEAFYKDLANRIPQELYTNKTSTANLFDIMGRHLEDKANEMQILGYPQLIMKNQYYRTLNSKEDFVGLIKESVNEQVGSEIAGLEVVRNVVDSAIAANHVGRITPIVLPTDDQELALNMSKNLGRIGARAFFVAAGKGAKIFKSTDGTFLVKEVERENVEACLKNINNLYKTR